MKTNPRQDKSLLLKTARGVVEKLWNQTEGTSMRLRWPSRVGMVNTGGWRAKIGDLGRGKPNLQIWLDYFAGHDARKFNFCFFWDNVAKMRRIADRAAKELPIHRRITHKDMDKHGGKFYFLNEPLSRAEFGAVILEEYWGEWSYYGIYDLTVRSSGAQVNPKLVARAASFFLSVARTMPNATPEKEEHGIYPQFENRKAITSHLQRERSSYLATERKNHDDYVCQVCGLRFEDAYGKLGEGFAEAHHRIPLHRLTGKVRTRMEDLATVCANCHRMLHKMEGKQNDVEKLRTIVRGRRRFRK
jgi:5-methylcytosine-specific restriction endonuclease McrA